MAKKTKTEVTTKSPTRQMWRRSVVVLVILVGVCFSTLIGKLAVLQIVETDEWQKRAVSQQMSDSIISAKRGAIYDTNMKKLVESGLVEIKKKDKFSYYYVNLGMLMQYVNATKKFSVQ